MRWLALLVLCLTAAHSLGGDPPRILSSEEWRKQLAEIDASGVTGTDRVSALRRIATNCLVDVKGKIRQIVLDVEGVDPTELVVCGVCGGPDLRSFIVGPEDVETVKTWRLWDRLAWRERPIVSQGGELSFELATRVGHCVRTVNPGFVPPPCGKKKGDERAFADWLAAFAKAAYPHDDKAAGAVWARGVETMWVLPGAVSLAEKGRFEVHLSVDGWIEATKQVPSGRVINNLPVMETKVLGRWGFEKGKDLVVTVEDPQAAALMTKGTRVDVAIDLAEDGAADAIAQRPFRASVRPWKVKGKR